MIRPGRNTFRLTAFAARRRRVHTPTVLQMEALECGAAALSIVLQYYGKRVPLEQLREACGVSRNGTKATAILRAAVEFGLLGKGLKKEPHELHELRLPFIVFWNFNHYVVVEGLSRKKIYLNDPASGPRTVTPEEFDQSFTGVVLAFQKSEVFQAGGERQTMLRMVPRRLARTGTVMAYLMLVTLALVVPGLVQPVLYKVYIDDILVGGMTDWLRPLLIAMLLAGGLKAVLTVMQQSSVIRMETNLTIRYSSEFLWHILRLPMQFFSQRWGNEIGGRLELNETVATLLCTEFTVNAVNALMIGAYALLLIQYDGVLATIVIATAAMNVPVLRWAASRRKNANRRLQQEQGKLLAVAIGGLQMMETLKASGGEWNFFARWAGHQAKVINAEQELNVTSQLADAIPPLLVALNLAAVLGFGGLRVIDGVLTIGMLIAFQNLTTQFTSPVNQLVGLGGKLQQSEAQLMRLDDVIRYPADPETTKVAGPRGAQTWRLEGDIELCDVTFGYSRLDPPLVKGISLKVKPGQRVALVGASGSGKSTLAKLITGLYRPWSGEILFSGKRRDEIPREVLCNSIAMVDQDIFLFHGHIRDNLTLWDATVPQTVLVSAAQDAQIHDDITNRPCAYHFTVDEGGRNFSGGQRQRLEIARALVTNPRILVLDEATSALDPRVESLVDDSLRRRGCTAIVIAHRLSTIRDCDEIIVLERGVVVERGTHEQMMRSTGPYYRLIQAH